MSRTSLTRSRSTSASVRLAAGPTSTVYTVLLLIAVLALATATFFATYESAMYYGSAIPFGPWATQARKDIDKAKAEAIEYQKGLLTEGHETTK